LLPFAVLLSIIIMECDLFVGGNLLLVCLFAHDLKNIGGYSRDNKVGAPTSLTRMDHS
jgi:hypothetical protein